ncbi:substrate-binding domain-containing protein [Rhodopseudomonas sp. P2A-2r]|uniref:substrate-binding domain-containing protein n=1 Tax=Rhodopseudomonas sp. P2A-2r TaxID=2991972 RepID=UPI002234B533|nr:substrate-binding domain-containing protein [Rhodopseudomonas sp. P2A-2r]UZE49830.1 substrate-binding domain-containing protein [Rhodopseudomonas sp. P2A-2r]
MAARDITLAERSTVTWLQITLLTAAGQLDRAVGECLTFLEKVGINWVPHPDQAAILLEYEPILQEIELESIDDRIAMPVISDPLQRIILDVLTAVLPPAFFTDNNLVCLVLCRMATISRTFGNSDALSLGYVYLGMVLGPRFGAWAAGYEFGQLGFRLSSDTGLDLLQPRVQMAFAYHVMPYSLPVAQGDALLREAFQTANERGDLTYAGFSSCTMISSLLFRGQPLAATQQEAETKLTFVTTAKFGLIVEIVATQLRLTRALRGLTQHFPAFDDQDFHESNYEAYLDANPELSIAACWYWIRKLQLRLIGGDFDEAVSAAQKAAPLVWTSGGHLELVEYHFHAGLAKAALCATASVTPDQLDEIRTHSAELAILAMQCPANFAHRSALLEGELAGINGRSFDALRLYQQAIDLAREHSYLQIEAFAHETAARFCMTSGLTSAGSSHLAQARDLYSTGASGVYLVSLIAQMGISDAVKPKLKETPSGVRIGTLIASGDAEIGFQQISELIHEPGVDYLGPLPADVQKVTIYSAGISNGTKQIGAAMALVKSITAPDAASVIKQHGMEPG